jgi:hypothetical protein
MLTMTREQFDNLSLDELIEMISDEGGDITSEEILIEFAKQKLDDNDFNLAIHVIGAIYEADCPDGSYYKYDYSMGTLETPTPITCKEDLEEMIDFEDEEE